MCSRARSTAGDSTRTAAGATTANMQDVSDKAKRLKMLTRTPLMRTAAVIATLGTAAKHSLAINECIEKASEDLGATAAMEPTHRHDKACIDMMRSLRTVLGKTQTRRIAKAGHIAVSVDESTDIATKGQMVVYVAFWCEERNEATVEFFTIKTLASGTAKDIVAALREIFPGSALADVPLAEGEAVRVEVAGSLWSKIVHLGSDGCTVMTGKDTGVGAMLRKDIVDLLQLHCCNHRLALGEVAALCVLSLSVSTSRHLSSLIYFDRWSSAPRWSSVH